MRHYPVTTKGVSNKCNRVNGAQIDSMRVTADNCKMNYHATGTVLQVHNNVPVLNRSMRMPQGRQRVRVMFCVELLQQTE